MGLQSKGCIMVVMLSMSACTMGKGTHKFEIIEYNVIVIEKMLFCN